MRRIVVKLVILIGFAGLIISCKKDSEEVVPTTIDGTWKIANLNVTLAGTTFDYWTQYNTFFPCTKNITISFDTKGTYSVFEPSGCVDDTGESFLPIGKTGSYTLTSGTKLLLKETGGQTLEGDVVIESDKITWKTQTDLNGVSTNIEAKFTRVN